MRTLQRNGVDNGNLLMDEFEYFYEDPVNGGYNNRLSWVKDYAGASAYDHIDIDNSMGAGNYTYDQLGQLISDADEGIQQMQWRLGDKKLKRITRSDAQSPELEFVYNPFGQRVLKIEKIRDSGIFRPQKEWKYTYYSYDANGQVMAVYDVVMSPEDNRAYAAEHHLYGASRVGMIQQGNILYDNGRFPSTGVQTTFQHIEGQTYYEMANYLGNVEAVITDRKMWMELATEEHSVQEVYYDQFTAAGDLLGWSFGDPGFTGNAPGAGYSITATGGQLVMYAGSTTGSLGSAMKSHYFENGMEYTLSFDIVTSTPMYVAVGNSGVNVLLDGVTSSGSYTYTFTGNGQTLWYGFACSANQTIRMDNIRLTKVVDHGYEAVVVRTADYYPYGMVMPGRNKEYVEGKYRFGYNGMEMDNEVSGNGNSYTTEFRQYDPRLGRWKSLDPLMADYPDMSPYVAFNNNPIFFVDPFGLEGTNPGVPENPNVGDVYTTDNGKEYEYGSDGIWAQKLPEVTITNTPQNIASSSTFSTFVQTITELLTSSGLSSTSNTLLPIGIMSPPQEKPTGLTIAPPGTVIEEVPVPAPSSKMDGLHNALDWLGMIPGVGEVFDAVNALVYAAEGDFVNAGISSAAIIPIFGSVSTGARQMGKAAAEVILETEEKVIRDVGNGFRSTKHTDNRHISRSKYPEKSKYSKPSQIEKLRNRTIKNPDKVTVQKNGRIVYEKNMKRKIGTKGQQNHKVVVDPKKRKYVTSYPTE